MITLDQIRPAARVFPHGDVGEGGGGEGGGLGAGGVAGAGQARRGEGDGGREEVRRGHPK